MHDKQATFDAIGCLPLKFVSILRICKIWFGHLLSLSLQFEYDPISGC
jgi:hypothetical protein